MMPVRTEASGTAVKIRFAASFSFCGLREARRYIRTPLWQAPERHRIRCRCFPPVTIMRLPV